MKVDWNRISEWCSWIAIACATLFSILLLALPLHTFSRYGAWLFKGIFIFFIASFVLSFFGKKRAKKETHIFGMSTKTLSIIFWIGFGMLIIALFLAKAGSLGSRDCPEAVQGNAQANLKILYFESPFCPYCWKEEPILRSLLERKGDLFSLERYDVRYCTEQTARYSIRGTPSFVFTLQNESAEFPVYGFIDAQKFEAIIDEMGSS